MYYFGCGLRGHGVRAFCRRIKYAKNRRYSYGFEIPGRGIMEGSVRSTSNHSQQRR